MSKLSVKQYWQKIKAIRSKKQVLDVFIKVEEFIKKLFSTVEFESWILNILMAVPRITIGYFLLFDFWRLKIGMPINELQSIDAHALAFFESFAVDYAKILPWLEKLGYWTQGGMLITGFNTRLLSLSLILTLLEHVFAQLYIMHLIPLFPVLLVLIIYSYSLVLGSGKLGIDFLISKKFSKKSMINYEKKMG